MPKLKKIVRTTIAEDSPILPDVIAEAVILDVERLVGDSFAPIPAAALDALCLQAEAYYQANDRFARWVQGETNEGRDHLRVCMEHWLASWLGKNVPKMFKALPEGYGWSYSPYLEAQKTKARRNP